MHVRAIFVDSLAIGLAEGDTPRAVKRGGLTGARALTEDARMRRPLHLVSNADARFFPGLAAALLSAVDQASGQWDYRIYVLDGGLEVDAMKWLQARLLEHGARKGIAVQLESLQVKEEMLASLPERRGSRMTFAKLLLPQLLPDLDELIYLDSDVLYFAGVEGIRPADEAARKHYLAGVLDFTRVLRNDCPWQKGLSREELEMPYINAGVMWMHLARLREDRIGEQGIALRAATPAMRRGDQPVFNYFCRGQMHLLLENMNYCLSLGSVGKLLAAATCKPRMNLHYIGSPKPWLGAPVTHKYLAYNIWHHYAREIGLDAFYEAPEKLPLPTPDDYASYRSKAFWYRFINPQRAQHYRDAVRSVAAV